MTQQWKLVPAEPTPEMWAAVNKLDDEMAAGAYDGKGASIEQVWNCLVDAAPTPPASAQDDAKDERQAFEAWAKKKKMPLARVGQQYDDFWVDHAWNGWQARASVAAPAAGDARALLDHPLLRDVLGYIEDAGPADVWGAAQSWMALRDAASQQQEG